VKQIKLTALVFILSVGVPVVQGQESSQAGDGFLGSATTLEYSKPAFVMNLSQMSGLMGSFQCTAKGDVLAEVSVSQNESQTKGPAPGRFLVLVIRPDGQTTNFPWDSVQGYRNLSAPTRTFASSDRIYVLTSAEKIETLSQGERPARLDIVLTFDQSGTLKSTIPLEAGLDPISLAAFPSGDILVLSKDGLNRRMRLTLLDSSGGSEREIRLAENDYAKHEGGSAEGDKGPVTFSLDYLLGSTEIYSYGQNLLFVPTTTSALPILELSKTGIVRAVVPKLPKGSVIAQFIPSNGATWKLRLGALNDNTYKLKDGDGLISGAAMNLSKRIVDINPSDGVIIHEVDLGTMKAFPTCAQDNDYLFLTSHLEDGRLQIVKGSAAH
jgi:hypothetical protein